MITPYLPAADVATASATCYAMPLFDDATPLFAVTVSPLDVAAPADYASRLMPPV